MVTDQDLKPFRGLPQPRGTDTNPRVGLVVQGAMNYYSQVLTHSALLGQLGYVVSSLTNSHAGIAEALTSRGPPCISTPIQSHSYTITHSRIYTALRSETAYTVQVAFTSRDRLVNTATAKSFRRSYVSFALSTAPTSRFPLGSTETPNASKSRMSP